MRFEQSWQAPPAGTPVLHVSQPTDAGVAKVVESLVRDQLGRGWEVHVACPPEGWLAAEVSRLGAVHHNWRATRSPGLGTLRESTALAQIVDHVDPALVHLHSAKAGLAGRLAIRARRPTVFQPHAWSFHAASSVTRYSATKWEAWGSRWTTLLIAVSQDEADQGERIGVVGPRALVPNGIDLPEDVWISPREARRPLDLEEAPTVVCLGRICRQKGQDRLLAAWPSVLDAVPDGRLIFVGDGPEIEELRAAASRLSGVAVLGDQTDVYRWLRAADIVALPSRWEAGVSLAAMEALASGRSVVLTDVEGASDIPTGVGAIVPQGDPSELVTAISDRLSNPDLVEAEGRRGYACARRRYDRLQSAEASARAYSHALQLHGGFRGAASR